MAKSQDSVHKPQFLKRKESRTGSNRGPSAYQRVRKTKQEVTENYTETDARQACHTKSSLQYPWSARCLFEWPETKCVFDWQKLVQLFITVYNSFSCRNLINGWIKSKARCMAVSKTNKQTKNTLHFFVESQNCFQTLRLTTSIESKVSPLRLDKRATAFLRTVLKKKKTLQQPKTKTTKIMGADSLYNLQWQPTDIDRSFLSRLTMPRITLVITLNNVIVVASQIDKFSLVF